jgi:bifunctional DNA-binding transcriptional regulator/antitoxin component of YhaV-PrlF toxin-antitoxin module
MRQRLKITSGGQVSLPAAVRRRWGVSSVSIEDRGDEVVLRPFPDDPIRAARGSLAKYARVSTDELRRQAREDEAAAEARKWSSSTRTP